MNRKYRRPIIAGNWKMNKTPTETRDYLNRFRTLLPRGRGCDVVLCVPAVCIPAAVKGTKDSRIAIGAQNCSVFASGAYTGEISAAMLTDAGCRYVILGHSERRAMGETDEDVNRKIKTAAAADLIPIVCCGESLAQRDAGVTEEWISMQVKRALEGVDPAVLRDVVIAYEPIWAIGTGRTATPEQAQAVCAHIRSVLRKLWGAKVARSVSILYGGSMNENNAAQLLAQPDVDGGLIGGASLVPEKLAEMIKTAAGVN